MSETPCAKWGDLGHNWMVIKGWLPWRRYRVCVACFNEERIDRRRRHPYRMHFNWTGCRRCRAFNWWVRGSISKPRLGIRWPI